MHDGLCSFPKVTLPLPTDPDNHGTSYLPQSARAGSETTSVDMSVMQQVPATALLPDPRNPPTPDQPEEQAGCCAEHGTDAEAV